MPERAITFCGQCETAGPDSVYRMKHRCVVHGKTQWFTRPPEGRSLCGDCRGTGSYPMLTRQVCKRCGGSGLEPMEEK